MMKLLLAIPMLCLLMGACVSSPQKPPAVATPTEDSLKVQASDLVQLIDQAETSGAAQILERLDRDIFITTLVTVSLAIIGYLVKYFNDLRVTSKQADLKANHDKLVFELNRVNAQLQHFYGPLKAINDTCRISYQGFRDKYANTNYLADGYGKAVNRQKQPAATLDKDETYRLWLRSVIFPMHDRMLAILLARIDLLIEDHIPPCLELLSAHIQSYQHVIAQWDAGDHSETSSVIHYPGEELTTYLDSSFQTLKARQQKLIDTLARKRGGGVEAPTHHAASQSSN